ncbi:MAG TPA: YARHG domain-containing protein [Longimicrobium sp.]|jgi:hypothetical protein
MTRLEEFLILALTAAGVGVGYADYIQTRNNSRSVSERVSFLGVEETAREGRPLRGSDLAGLDCVELDLLRNVVFARYGRAFTKSREARDYFSAQPWYKIDPHFTTDRLTDLDWRNVKAVERAEAKMVCPK